MPLVLLVAGLCGVLGLAVGSFLNVVVYRVPAGLSVVRPRSACPDCGHAISAWENIPVLSWILLRGRCRSCAKPISIRYPLVEVAGAVAFALVAAWVVQASWPAPLSVAVGLRLVALLYLAAVSIALAIIDLQVHRLPDRIVLPSYAVGGLLLAAAGVLDGDLVGLARAAAGAGVSVAFYLLLALIKPGAMSLGDIKLAGVLGLYLGAAGWAQLVVGTFAAFLLGGIAALVLLAVRRVGRRDGIPFGPWMLLGAWVGLIAGAPLTDLYLRLAGLG